MIGEEFASPDAFRWRYGRYEVTVSQEESGWRVVYETENPLLGPRMIVHQARHQLPTHAAWDVLTRVSRATHDKEIGVEVAQHAARWMCNGLCAGIKQPV